MRKYVSKHVPMSRDMPMPARPQSTGDLTNWMPSGISSECSRPTPRPWCCLDVPWERLSTDDFSCCRPSSVDSYFNMPFKGGARHYRYSAGSEFVHNRRSKKNAWRSRRFAATSSTRPQGQSKGDRTERSKPRELSDLIPGELRWNRAVLTTPAFPWRRNGRCLPGSELA